MVSHVFIPAGSPVALYWSMHCLHGSFIQVKASSLWKIKSIKLEENRI